MHNYNFTYSIIFLGGLTVVWWYPYFLTETALAYVISVVYGMLLGRLVKIILQYNILRWGVHRYGVLLLGAALALAGIAALWYGWQGGIYGLITVGWMLVYVGYDSAYAAFKRRLGDLRAMFIVTLEYILIALMGMVLFSDYLARSPVGGMNVEYQGIGGENLLFVAIIVLLVELVHRGGILLWKHAKRMSKKRFR